MADTPDRNQPSPEDRPVGAQKAEAIKKDKKPKLKTNPADRVKVTSAAPGTNGSATGSFDRTSYRVSHKKWAFILVMTVVGFQMTLIGGIFVGCFAVYPTIPNRDPSNERCSGSQATEMLLSLAAQSFALYAAEK